MDSEQDESESEAEVAVENLKMTPGTYSYVSTADMAPLGIRECQKTRIKSSEEVGARRHPCLRRLLLWFHVCLLHFVCEAGSRVG